MVILAVDSGLEKTGFAVFKKTANGRSNFKYIISGLIQTSKKNTIQKRLGEIYASLQKLAKTHRPDILVLEQLFFFKNQKTAIWVSQAQGIALLVASQKNIRVDFLTPLQVKLAVTGYGKADKKSVQKMLAISLKLKEELKQDDQADAIACGLAYCYLNRELTKE
ncbi:crossover junction endodeoxyribonuclease RuvC [Candidatus Roizmanbacteria bacterium]|nr:crossover junction endodeoxyribonuclease RuvC [Candidatus Roizmanbacteria bacterium]